MAAKNKILKSPLHVKRGERVFLIWDNGLKLAGRVIQLGKMMLFDGEKLQTYSVRCDDGFTRPAHGRHIKKVFRKRAA